MTSELFNLFIQFFPIIYDYLYEFLMLLFTLMPSLTGGRKQLIKITVPRVKK